MEALYFKGLLSQIFTVRRISLASVLCVEMSPEARQKQNKARQRYLVYKGISVYFSLQTGKGDVPHPFTAFPPALQKILALFMTVVLCFVNVYFSWGAVI